MRGRMGDMVMRESRRKFDMWLSWFLVGVGYYVGSRIYCRHVDDSIWLGT